MKKMFYLMIVLNVLYIGYFGSISIVAIHSGLLYFWIPLILCTILFFGLLQTIVVNQWKIFLYGSCFFLVSIELFLILTNNDMIEYLVFSVVPILNITYTIVYKKKSNQL